MKAKSALKRKALDSDRNRGKVETPEAELRRLDFLPAEKQAPAAERNGPRRFSISIKGPHIPV
ncbi:hypothetical protein [Rossellomorea marisflavi]|uniref:hypothetical protein n=1 Tax=Rossellomorea marisflavi TaxID=189381 RepID=UPI000ADE8D2C|nr:hypothetical protein [Rossellomorea marisflavi]